MAGDDSPSDPNRAPAARTTGTLRDGAIRHLDGVNSDIEKQRDLPAAAKHRWDTTAKPALMLALVVAVVLITVSIALAFMAGFFFLGAYLLTAMAVEDGYLTLNPTVIGTALLGALGILGTTSAGAVGAYKFMKYRKRKGQSMRSGNLRDADDGQDADRAA